MRRYVLVALVFCAVFGAAYVSAHPALADALTDAIVPQCDQTGAYGTAFSGACQLCDLVKLARNLINFAVAFSVIVATLMFTYAGVLYFTSAAKDNIKKAHGIFIKVFVGLVIILSAWLVVDLIMGTLVGQSFLGSLPWQSFQCTAYPNGPALSNINLSNISSGGGGGGGGGGLPYSPSAEQAARTDLATRGGGHITLNNNGTPCTTPQSSGCTNVGGLTDAARNGLVDLQHGCNCNIVITGGTEQGPHATHTGNQVDIRFDQTSAAYIQAHRAELGITKICTTAAQSAYSYNCGNYTEPSTEPHLHLDFGG